MQAPRTATPGGSMSRIVASLALISLLCGCGLKGPLFMPTAEADPDQQRSQDASSAGPAASDMEPSANPMPGTTPGATHAPPPAVPGASQDATRSAPR